MCLLLEDCLTNLELLAGHADKAECKGLHMRRWLAE